MNTILVTGGAGYIGSVTAWQLAQKGYNVIVLDLLIHNQTFNYPWATFIHGDYGDAILLEHIFTTYNITAVMHFGAFIEVGASVKNPALYYHNNVFKTDMLLNAMRKQNITTFVFSSSCAVYGIPQTTYLTEAHPRNPISPYGKTKYMVEMILEDYATVYGLKSVALRYFNACGAVPEQGLYEQHYPETHVIPLLLNAAQQQTPFAIFGTDYPTSDGTCIRDYVHVADIAHAHCQALEYLKTHTGFTACNLGTGTGYSVKELISYTEEITEKKISSVICARRMGDPERLVAQAGKAQELLHWIPQYTDIKKTLLSIINK